MSVQKSIGNWPGESVAVVLVLALLIQGLAGLALRGLYADGAFFVTQILASQSFVYAPSRWMSNVIAEFPAMTAIKLGIGTPNRVALIFSVTTNVLPGVLFLLCRLALPAAERRFFVFPAFVYFAGTLASQFASVTEGLVSTAYVWLLLYLILFGRLTAWRLSLILLLSIGCLRLHEEMSFLGPLLIAAVWLRWRDATPPQPARLALGLALLAILASAVVGSYWILFPYAPEERALFVSQSLLDQRWLYVPGAGWNLPAALGLLSSIAILTCIAAPNIARDGGFGLWHCRCHPGGRVLLDQRPNGARRAILRAAQWCFPFHSVDDPCNGRAFHARCLPSPHHAVGSVHRHHSRCGGQSLAYPGDGEMVDLPCPLSDRAGFEQRHHSVGSALAATWRAIGAAGGHDDLVVDESRSQYSRCIAPLHKLGHRQYDKSLAALRPPRPRHAAADSRSNLYLSPVAGSSVGRVFTDPTVSGRISH